MEPALDDLLKHLKIREDEDQGIVLEEDIEELKAGARWTALAKVLSLKPFSHAAFLANMKYAWSLAKDFSFKAIDENLFVLQFSCLGDWCKVLDDGPWLFRGNPMLLEEYDGIRKPSSVKFQNLNIWARVYDLPTGFRTKNIARQIGEKIGEVLKVDLGDETSGWRDYLRIRVKLDITKPLTRIVYVSVGDKRRLPFRVKYERLPKFCAVCGLLGHIDSECGDGVHDITAYQYGDWLIASPERKGRLKESRSSDSANTRESDPKDLGKTLAHESSNEPRSEDSNLSIYADDNVDLKDNERSTLKRNLERKRLSLGEMEDNNKLPLALVPTTIQKEGILVKSRSSAEFFLLTD